MHLNRSEPLLSQPVSMDAQVTRIPCLLVLGLQGHSDTSKAVVSQPLWMTKLLGIPYHTMLACVGSGKVIQTLARRVHSTSMDDQVTGDTMLACVGGYKVIHTLARRG